jgi:hypothetical protein
VFTHLLPNDDNLFTVEFSDYAKRHYLKRFEKEYTGDLPKNKGEQAFIQHTLNEEFRDYLALVR